jgi:hypothetical protein
MCHLTEAFTNGTGPLSSNVDLPAWGYRVYVKDTQPRTSRYILYDKFDRNKLPRCSAPRPFSRRHRSPCMGGSSVTL